MILRVNTAHPFYQKVWQPLGELAKRTVELGDSDSGEWAGQDVADKSRKALVGLQLLLLSLARAANADC